MAMDAFHGSSSEAYIHKFKKKNKKNLIPHNNRYEQNTTQV